SLTGLRFLTLFKRRPLGGEGARRIRGERRHFHDRRDRELQRIEEFLETCGVQRCPPRYAAVTSPPPSACDYGCCGWRHGSVPARRLSGRLGAEPVATKNTCSGS